MDFPLITYVSNVHYQEFGSQLNGINCFSEHNMGQGNRFSSELRFRFFSHRWAWFVQGDQRTFFAIHYQKLIIIHRLYCRIAYVKYVGVDDYFIIAALTVAIAVGIMNGFQVSYGTG